MFAKQLSIPKAKRASSTHLHSKTSFASSTYVYMTKREEGFHRLDWNVKVPKSPAAAKSHAYRPSSVVGEDRLKFGRPWRRKNAATARTAASAARKVNTKADVAFIPPSSTAARSRS